MNTTTCRAATLVLGALMIGCDSADRRLALGPVAEGLTADAEKSEAPAWSEWSAAVNLGPIVNSTLNDNHPAVSKDGVSLYITSGRPGGVNGANLSQFEEIWVAHRASLDADWEAPVNLGPSINIVGSNTGSPTFTPDGHQMYFHSNRPGGCGLADLYVARRHNKHDDLDWGPAENLGCVVNGTANDNGPTYFEDEASGITTLYFTSTRLGGPGDFDIYASTRAGDDGEFGPAVLVAELSAPGRDTRTAIRRDGLEMFLSSDGSGRVGGIGSQDIWVSTRATTRDPWSTPVNLGPTVNSTAFDGAPALSFDGTTLYFFSERVGGFGKRDLYVTTRQRIHTSASAEAPLVSHVVGPQTTDPIIDQALSDHYAWLDTAAVTNHNLFVFMPGTGLTPGAYQLVQQEAARLGYHVIGLMYPNSVGLAKVCPTAPEPAACYEGARLEVIDGIDRSPLVNVNEANSIDNRLTKLLQYLAAQYPGEGWDRFLIAGDTPKWSQIAVSGHSQGGGHAAMIARIRLVARVVMFSSVTDSLEGASVPWVASHVTPSNRYYGLDHDLDEQFRGIRASWDSLGMGVFGPAVDPDDEVAPYGFTHMLVTNHLPLRGPGRAAHGASCVDANTPLAADGTPLFRDAWDYLLTGLPRRPGNGRDVAARDER